MIAARYLRAKRQESFISVISLFSLIGIALGVATLIIVMSVMNGFKVELLKSILGLSGHVTIQSQLGHMPDYDQVTARVLKVPGVVRAAPDRGWPGDGQPERRQYRRDRARHPRRRPGQDRRWWPRSCCRARSTISRATMW